MSRVVCSPGSESPRRARAIGVTTFDRANLIRAGCQGGRRPETTAQD
jgi:hypothetical protein